MSVAIHGEGVLYVSVQHTARRAGGAIANGFTLLETDPDIGRPLQDLPKLRELIIAFGDTGYAALYRHEAKTQTVYILAFRHQKETGYS